MGILRSEDMALYQINMPREAAYDIVSTLGKLGTIQFIDADEWESAQFQRHYYNNVKRIEDTQGKLENIQTEINKFQLQVQKSSNVQAYLNRLDNQLSQYNKSKQKYYEELEAYVDKKVTLLQQLLSNFDDAVIKRNSLIEERAVLNQVSKIYNSGNLQEELQAGNQKLLNFAGTIEIQDQERFQRTVFRATRGNCWTIIEEMKDDINRNQCLINLKTRQVMKKCVFIVLIPCGKSGGSQNAIESRIERVCESFGATIIDVPQNYQIQEQRLLDVNVRCKDLNELVRLNEDQLEQFYLEFTALEGHEIGNLEENGGCSRIESMKMYCHREKLIYTQMNLLNAKNSIYQGLVWIQKDKEAQISQQIFQLSSANPNMPMGQIYPVEKYNIEPPTYISTNEFTAPFQEIVNTYGVPNYKEANPGLFCLSTFPFLFGVMFGDIGHGSIVLFFSLYLLCMTPKKINPGILDQMYAFRYLLLLMGINATFCGFIYNDFLGMSVNLFGSCYSTRTGMPAEDCTYPMGMDPIWGIASNKLAQQNSLKMKMSVILGVSQMLVGVFLKAANSIYFGNALTFFFEFIPQLVFLCCTFGYMCFMIILKWSIGWQEDTSQAPSILTLLLRFFLNFGDTDPKASDLYEGQPQLQFYLLIAALISVPMMLLPKPLIMNFKHGKKNNAADQPAGYLAQVDEEEPLEEQVRKEPICPYQQKDKEFDFSEEFVHQIIETIEFVLGCISHTASYLRLWALSLAHSQLSEVFFDKTMIPGLKAGNPLLICIGFLVFACVTFGVLMCMDAMECFLHTLRLHWVEFQSKFYKAEGYKFEPFCYVEAIERENK